MDLHAEYSTIQQIAKIAMAQCEARITAGMSLARLRALTEQSMLSMGADGFWYWGIGALVHSGSDTVVSESGKRYRTPDATIADNDLVTVDLSPRIGKIWGDYARTFAIQDGAVVADPHRLRNAQWRDGLLLQECLHDRLRAYVAPDMTFEQLHAQANRWIADSGYRNADFLGNLGHSIATAKRKRIYIERGNRARLDSVRYFTFEPHIVPLGGVYGFKREDIYYFSDGVLQTL